MPDELFGTALLIKPSFSDASPSSSKSKGGTVARGEASTHFIGCVFTSHHYGHRRDSPSAILKATEPAMRDLLTQVAEWNASVDVEKRIGGGEDVQD